jgi:glycosyltransferase involved in cell wall biosynthesis
MNSCIAPRTPGLAGLQPCSRSRTCGILARNGHICADADSVYSCSVPNGYQTYMTPRQALFAKAPESSAIALPVVLIPAYKPTSILSSMVKDLTRADHLGALVIVNDGSGPEYQHIFEELFAIEKVHVLTHVINMGKGAALKNGLNYASCHFPNAVGVITADADGQHAPADILELANHLLQNPTTFIIGSRSFSRNIPLRSYLGNTLTGFIFACLTGRRLHDTQSGLRAVPRTLIPAILPLEGQRYDYEMSMLFYVAKYYSTIEEHPIETIYIGNNDSSHFHPLTDSAKIYYKLLQFYASSALTAILDLIFFWVAMKFTGNLVFSFFVGRVLIAALVNFNINRRYVFQSKESSLHSLVKYYGSFSIFALVSFSIVRVLIGAGMNPVIAKAATESVLSVFSFGVQGAYVFAERKLRER